MTATTLPTDWAPLREAAEVMAREAYAANVRRFEEHGWSTVELHGGNEYAMEGLRLFSLAQADLLADLTRPASRDWAARLLAEKVGLEVGATAPEWRRFRMGLPNGTESWAWALLGKPGEQFFFTDGNVPGISTLTDPAAALRAALLVVVPHAE